MVLICSVVPYVENYKLRFGSICNERREKRQKLEALIDW